MTGIDGKSYTSDQATIWRWRTAFQHDFAARMDWTIKDAAEANHAPRVVVNGRRGHGADRRSTRWWARPSRWMRRGRPTPTGTA